MIATTAFPKTFTATLFAFVAALLLFSDKRADAENEDRCNGADCIELNVDKMYVSRSFAADEDVFVVLEGLLPNSCYSALEPEIHIDAEAHVVRIFQSATPIVADVLYCADVQVPYLNKANVGILEPGNWVVLTNAGRTIDFVRVLPDPKPDCAELTADGECLMAPIENVRIKGKENQRTAIEVVWEMRNTCMRLDNVKVKVEKEVIEMTPSFKMVNHDMCEPMTFPYIRDLKLPPLPKGRHMLRIHSPVFEDHLLVFDPDESSLEE
jgi:hypothetical protein